MGTDHDKTPYCIHAENWPILWSIPCEQLAQARFVSMATYSTTNQNVPRVIVHMEDNTTHISDTPGSNSNGVRQLTELNGVALRAVHFNQSGNNPFMLALGQDGTVRSTGSNKEGQLGRHDTTNEDTFALVEGLGSNVKQVALGEAHCLALTEDNQVFAWGSNSRGQLGIGEAGGQQEAPQKIFPVNGGGDVVADIACGSLHSVILMASGKVLQFGDWQYGNKESDEPTVTPTAVPGLDGINITQVSCGIRYTLALTADGTVYSWGRNRFGELGLGKKEHSVSTATRIDFPEKITFIRAARSCCVARTINNNTYVWGRYKEILEWTPKLVTDNTGEVDALAAGNWGPETDGSIALNGSLFGYWRLSWLDGLCLSDFLALGSRPSAYNPWTTTLREAARLATTGSQGINSQDEDGATALHLVARFKHHSGNTPDSSKNDDILKRVLARLMEEGADVNSQDELGATPIHDAVVRDNDVAVTTLLEVPGVDLKITDKSSRTCLHVAAKLNRLEMVQQLILSGADVTASTGKGKKPIHFAIRENHVEMMELLNKMASADVPSSILSESVRGMTCCDMALEKESWDMLRALLKQVSQAPLKRYKRPGQVTALDVLTEFGRNVLTEFGQLDMMRMLLDVHPDLLQLPGEEGATALHQTARLNRIDVATLLLERGADTEARDDEQNMPLHIAIQHGSIDVAEALVQHGTKMDAMARGADTALHLMVKTNNFELFKMLYGYLEEQGLADHMMNAGNADKRTPLHLAVEGGSLEIVQMLMNKGAALLRKDIKKRTALHVAADKGKAVILRALMVEAKQRSMLHRALEGDGKGSTPLHVAAHEGYSQAAEVLLQFRPAIKDEPDNHGWTAVYFAAEHNHIDTLEVLIAAGVDLTVRDHHKNTPLHVAAQAGQAEAVAYLVQHGASTKDCNDHGFNALDIAICEKREDVVSVILESDAWRESLDKQCIMNIGTSKLLTTPFRQLITVMPDKAETVLDNSISIERSTNKGKREVKLKFDFHYLEEPLCITSTNTKAHKHEHESNSTKESIALLENMTETNDLEPDGHGHSHSVPAVRLQPPQKDRLPFATQADKHVLEVMASSKQILKHPLVRAFLRMKWQTTRYFVFSFLAFYVTFVGFLSMYLMLSLPPSEVDPAVMHERHNCSPEAEAQIHGTELWVAEPKVLNPIAIVIVVLASVGILMEVIQIILMRDQWLEYLRGYQHNMLDWFAYLAAIIIVLPLHACHVRLGWQWGLGLCCIMVVWANLILFLRRLPMIGIYLVIIIQMAKMLVMCLLGCLPVILTFVVAFVVLHHNQAPFGNPIFSFFKVLVMMIGELDFGSQFHPEDESEAVGFIFLAYLTYFLFLVVVTTVIMNLITGIAVTSMEAILSEAEEQKLLLEANLTLDVDLALPKGLRGFFRWHRPCEEVVIKDKHLQRMPLDLRNKLLHGHRVKGCHGKAQKFTNQDVLNIALTLFPGRSTDDSEECGDMASCTRSLEVMGDKVDALASELVNQKNTYESLATMQDKMGKLEQMLQTLIQNQDKDGQT